MKFTSGQKDVRAYGKAGSFGGQGDTGLRAVVYCLIVFNVRFYCFLCSTPPVQSKIASFSSLTLRSQRRSSTVAKRQTRRLSFFTQKWLNSACAIKDCFVRFAHNGGWGTVSQTPAGSSPPCFCSHTLWNKNVRKSASH